MKVPYHRPPKELSAGLGALTDAYEAGHGSNGPEQAAFEEKLGERFDCLAVVFDSCTSAMEAYAHTHSALRTRITVPALTWNSTANAFAKGGDVRLVDVDDHGRSHSIPQVTPGERHLDVAVSLYGNPTDRRLFPNCIQVIDGAQGFEHGFVPTSHATFLSFGALKSLPIGMGGALLTRDQSLARDASLHRDHGIDRKISRHQLVKHATKSTLSAPLCAMGSELLQFVDEWLDRRETISHRYAFELRVPHVPHAEGSCHHAFIVLPDKPDRLQTWLAKQGIGSMRMYEALPDQKAWDHGPDAAMLFPNACHIGRRAVSLPLYPAMTMGEVSYVIDEVNRWEGWGA